MILILVPLLVVNLFQAEFSLGEKYLRVTVQPLNPFPNPLSAYCLTGVERGGVIKSESLPNFPLPRFPLAGQRSLPGA